MQDFVLLATFHDYMGAHLLVSKLESENIRCVLNNELSNTLTPYLSYSNGGIELLVAKVQYERALTIVNETGGTSI